MISGRKAADDEKTMTITQNVKSYYHLWLICSEFSRCGISKVSFYGIFILDFLDVEYPKDTRRRLKLYDKVPQPLTASAKIAKQTKRLELMRGPELVHNTLVYGDYGIQVRLSHPSRHLNYLP